MNYVPLAIASPILMAVCNIIQKKVVTDDKVEGHIFAVGFGLLVALLTLPFALVFESIHIQPIPVNVYPMLLLMTILYAIAMWLFYTALKHIPVSEIVFFDSSIPIWVLVGSVLFLHESLTTYKIGGVVLLVSGILLAFRAFKISTWTKYHWYALVASMMYAFAYMTDKYILNFLPPISYQVLSFGLPSVVLLLVYKSQMQTLRYFITSKKARNIIWSSVFAGLSFIALYKAYALSDELSIVNPLFETKALWTVLFGIVLLKEREHMQYKIFGMFISLIGIFFIL